MKKLVLKILPILILLIIGCTEKNEVKIESVVEESILKPINKILFVGKEQNNDAIYQYKVDKKEYELFWSNKNETVYELSYNSDFTSAFFITAKAHGKKGLLPFIDNVNIYIVDFKNEKVDKVASIGNGIQITISWDDLTTCKVVMNKTTSSPENFIEQIVYLFSTNGKKIFEEKNNYNLLETGYPKLPNKIINTISNSGNYQIKEAKQDIEFAFVLDSKKNNAKFLITSSPFPLHQAGWTLDELFLVFTTVDISPYNETLFSDKPTTSILYIFSTSKQLLLNNLKGAGIKNFLITGNLLFYDDGFGSNSKISILDLNKNEVIEIIEIKGGCGIKSIPQIPNYDA